MVLDVKQAGVLKADNVTSLDFVQGITVVQSGQDAQITPALRMQDLTDTQFDTGTAVGGEGVFWNDTLQKFTMYRPSFGDEVNAGALWSAADGQMPQRSGSDWVPEYPVPPGAIMMWSTNAAPTGWALCNGGTVLRTTPLGQVLVAAGMPYGTGNGSTTVTLPNMAGRFPLALGVSPYNVLGTKGGEETHALTTDEIPQHTHNFTQYRYTFGTNNSTANSGGGARLTTAEETYPPGTTGANASSQLAHNNMPPYFVIHFIIKL